MQINESLNLVLPIRDGLNLYHTPISREVFEANCVLLGAVKSRMISKGLHFLMDAGPRVSSSMLREEAKKDAQERGEDNQAATALLGEFKRLSVILTPGTNGYDPLPIDAALSRGVIDAEEWQEAESAIAFFTCHYALAKKADRAKVASATALALKGLTTSLSPMEYVASLPNSTQVETTPKVISSLPS